MNKRVATEKTGNPATDQEIRELAEKFDPDYTETENYVFFTIQAEKYAEIIEEMNKKEV